MKAPKILPRVAHQAGISEALALKIWRRALSEAEYLLGNHDSPEFFALAVKRFIDLVNEESTLDAAPGLTWMWEHQARLSVMSLETAQNALRFWQSAWQDVLNAPKAA